MDSMVIEEARELLLVEPPAIGHKRVVLRSKIKPSSRCLYHKLLAQREPDEQSRRQQCARQLITHRCEFRIVQVRGRVFPRSPPIHG